MGNITEKKTNESLSALVADTKGHALLDTGCSTTVCGEQWLESFMEDLSDDDRLLLRFAASSKPFTFGDGKTFVSKRRVTFPCWMGGLKGELTTDVVRCNIPLLLSRSAMESAKMHIKCDLREVLLHGRAIKLRLTRSGHYALPISL